MCVVPGDRRFGQACGANPFTGCAGDQVCFLGICTVPCSRENDDVCPQGTTCEHDRAGNAACAVSCETTGCPDGLACSKATGVCQQGPDCFTDRSLCAENEKCIRQSTARGGARWTFACQRRCSLGSGCGPGQVCGYLDACFDSCDPSGQCAEGFQCGTVDEEGRTYGCKPLPPKR